MRDPALERAFAESQSWAYEAAYRRYGARMLAAALRVLGDRDAASDCVHDVLLRLWSIGDAYDVTRGSLEGFLVTCARNRALERVRSAQRLSAAALRAVPEHEDDEAFPDPIEQERIARAIASLPPAQAQAIELAYYRGMTHAEIASDLDTPVGTVKSRINAALRSLRLWLVVASFVIVLLLGTLFFRTRGDDTQRALLAMVGSHFEHAQFAPVAAASAPNAKLIYARDGSWLYIVADGAAFYDVYAIGTNGAVRLGSLTPHGETSSLFADRDTGANVIELREGSRVIERAELRRVP
jgi:RNA polymerase sigma-70 factor, ECF subfamily